MIIYIYLIGKDALRSIKLTVIFKNRRLENSCTDRKETVKTYEEENAAMIHHRIDELRSAESVEMLLKYRIGKCHKLKGNMKGKYAMHLKEPYRLVFMQKNSETVIITEIIDYH